MSLVICMAIKMDKPSIGKTSLNDSSRNLASIAPRKNNGIPNGNGRGVRDSVPTGDRLPGAQKKIYEDLTTGGRGGGLGGGKGGNNNG